MRHDRFLSEHVPFYIREMRVKAYTQFLESYRSVTLASMAERFAVSEAFLDKELSRFIAAHKINAKIDKMTGVVETKRPDARNAQYAKVIVRGDLLLNKIQKLARVVST